jgi:2-methylisocitrate lyase-like PEP mutase family enzyme
VRARDETDPSFVIMAQCYARDAVNGGLEEVRARVRRYREQAGVDWVQFEGPHSADEIATVRDGLDCWFSAMQVGHPLSHQQHLDLALAAAWYTVVPALVLQSAAYEFLEQFNARGIDAWTEYRPAHKETFDKLAALGR